MVSVKSAFFIALTAVSASSFALELGLVLDGTNKDVRRFDTFTGTSYGSFGAGYLLDPQSIEIKGTTAYVLDRNSFQGQVRKFNYNTGEYLGTLALQSFNVSTNTHIRIGSDGFIYASAGDSSCTAKFNPTTGTNLGYFCFAGGDYESGITEGSDGRIYAIDRINKKIGAAAKANFTSFAAFWPTASAALAITIPNQMTAFGGNLYWAEDGNDTVGILGESFSGFSTISVDAVLDNVTGVAFAHNGTLYVAGTAVGSATAGKFARYDVATKTLIGTFGGFSGAPKAIAILAAPEPGSLIALMGAGLALVFRRRRA